MRLAFRLLIAFSVLWCGLHFDDPAQAHGPLDAHHLAGDAGHASEEDSDSGDGPTKAAHSGHVHCPVAPDQAAPTFECSTAAGDELLTGREMPGLTSRSQAPPLQPPSA